MTQRTGHYAYLSHAHRLVHVLRRGLLVFGCRGFYMGILVRREDAKVTTSYFDGLVSQVGYYQSSLVMLHPTCDVLGVHRSRNNLAITESFKSLAGGPIGLTHCKRETIAEAT